jgi:hypothetical protein
VFPSKIPNFQHTNTSHFRGPQIFPDTSKLSDLEIFPKLRWLVFSSSALNLFLPWRKKKNLFLCAIELTRKWFYLMLSSCHRNILRRFKTLQSARTNAQSLDVHLNAKDLNAKLDGIQSLASDLRISRKLLITWIRCNKTLLTNEERCLVVCDLFPFRTWRIIKVYSGKLRLFFSLENRPVKKKSIG